MRPVGSSSWLYVLLSLRTRTATTTPSSQGISALTRTSRFNWQARVTEAILSSRTVFTLPAPRSRHAGVELTRQRGDARETPRVGRRPFAGRLTVDAARGVAQREGRGDALDEHLSRPEKEI